MKIQISYQTQDLPPPFAFAALFDVSIQNEALDVNFSLHYLERDQISGSEILAEGYTLEDDFEWKGRLGRNWIDPVKNLVSTRFLSEPKESFYIHIIADEKKGFPDLSDDVVIQELMQAVLEASKREAPLSFLLCQEFDQEMMQFEFANRSVLIDNRRYDWESAYKLMVLLYSIDLDEASASKSPLKNSVSIEENRWISIDNKEFWNLYTNLRSQGK